MIRGLCNEWYTNTRNKVLIILLISSLILYYFFATFAGGKLRLEVNTINLTEFNQDYGSNFNTLDEIRYWFDNVGKAENKFHTLLADPTFIQFLCFFFAATYIGMGFSDRTISLPLRSGISRRSVYRSKCISFFLVAALLLVISFLFTQLCTAGIPFAFSFQYVMKRIVLRLIIDLAILSPTFALGYLFRNPIKIACTSFAYFAILAIVDRISVVSQYIPLNFIPLYLSKHYMIVLTPSIIWHILLVSSCWILTSILAGWVIFRHLDLK